MKELLFVFLPDGSFVVRIFTDFLGYAHRVYSPGTKVSEVVAAIELSSPVIPSRDENGFYVESLVDGWLNGYYIE